MSSYSGYINYVEYVAGIDKGDVKQGDLFNSPFGLGKVDEKYTSSRVVEEIAAEATKFEPAWTPVVGDVEGRVKATGAWEKIADLGTFDAGKYDKARYIYNNEVIPQEKLPTVKAIMKTMPLVAKARRIAIYFSQFAAFQAKTDYGFDLGDQLAEKAVGQLSYEIDNEVVDLLVENAEESDKLKFNVAQRVGESMFERYEAFAKVIADATQIIYDRTKRLTNLLSNIA